MPSVELTHDEARTGDLPFVCMVCGQAGHVYRRTVLSYTPFWVYLGIPLGVLPYFILALFFNRRRRLCAPLCELHQFHWLWRRIVGDAWLVLNLLALLTGVLLLVAIIDAEAPPSAREFIIGGALGALIVSEVGLVTWPVLVLALKYSGIHLTAVGPHHITLGPVPAEFVEALRVHREDRRPNLDRAFREA
jgi:hypothetical protein